MQIYVDYNVSKFSHTVEVFVPRIKLFRASTEFENYPKLIPKYKSVEIISKEGNTITTEDEIIIKGKPTKQKVKHTLYEPHKHLIEILSGNAQGSLIEEIFDETSTGTIVTINADYKLQGVLKLVGFALKGKFKYALENIIMDFADHVESEKNIGK